ncbi:diguanylate cyclase [Butyrivibrio proteoclasticus]|uniref:diguanylate cyclase n=1 Tax=Butyrivibrio proteoclasticus TaxID=43305 RepID=UPI00047E6591|nr:diguanylate cyclase [Butyrivibrio proteoclasticus]
MKYWQNRKIQIPLIILILLFLVLGLFKLSSFALVKVPDIIDLDEGWTIMVNGQTLEETSLSRSDVGVIDENESVSIIQRLDDFGIDNPCLEIYTIQSAIYVYLDSSLIYSFGDEEYKNDHFVPKKYNFIPLGDDYAGKILKIKLYGSTNSSFSGISKVTIGDRRSMFISHIAFLRIPMFSGAFMITLGIILMILSPYLAIYHNNDLRLFFSGLISLLLGVYIAGFYGVLDFFINAPMINTYSEYMAFYNIPTAILGYLFCVYQDKIKRIFRGMFLMNLVLFASIVIMVVLDIFDISAFVPLLHALAGAECLSAIVIMIYDFVKKRKENGATIISADNIFLIGLILYMICSLYDVISYNYIKYTTPLGESYARLNGFAIGSLIFISSLLVSYLIYNISSPLYDSLQSTIKSLAYTDPLTGLANRARCEQMFETLTEEHGTYTIISLDLNKLKQVNDTLGHHEGDRLLTGFSTILTDCFWDATLVGRMGGDEFVVILLEDGASSCTKRIHELYAMISDWNKKEQHFQYSASYGYAYSYEVPSGSASEVYMLADSRMYEMKKEHRSTDSEKEVIENA